MSSHILDTVKENHRELESFYSALTHCGDPEEQTAFQNKLTWALARHLVAEELVIYPAIERYVREGMEVADEERREHQAVCLLGIYLKFPLTSGNMRIDQRTPQKFPGHAQYRPPVPPHNPLTHGRTPRKRPARNHKRPGQLGKCDYTRRKPSSLQVVQPHQDVRAYASASWYVGSAALRDSCSTYDGACGPTGRYFPGVA